MIVCAVSEYSAPRWWKVTLSACVSCGDGAPMWHWLWGDPHGLPLLCRGFVMCFVVCRPGCSPSLRRGYLLRNTSATMKSFQQSYTIHIAQSPRPGASLCLAITIMCGCGSWVHFLHGPTSFLWDSYEMVASVLSFTVMYVRIMDVPRARPPACSDLGPGHDNTGP